jgi:AraC-like DNA-binding protein
MSRKMFFVRQSEISSQLPFVLYSLGRDHLQESIHRPDGLPLYQWIQTIQGAGVLEIDGHQHAVEEGEGMLLFPDVGHRYHATSRQWKVHYIGFVGYGVQPFCESAGIRRSGVYRVDRPDQAARLMEELYGLHVSSHATMYEYSKLLYGILLELARSLGSPASGHKHRQEQGHIVHLIMDYINQHYMEPVSLADLADRVKMSREYLCHLFKKITGFTILDYLIDVRISHAKTLLVRYPDEPLRNISRRCGYEDVSYFCKVFRKEEGMTPATFREMHR